MPFNFFHIRMLRFAARTILLGVIALSGCNMKLPEEGPTAAETVTPIHRKKFYEKALGEPQGLPRDMSSEMLEAPALSTDNNEAETAFPIYKPGKFEPVTYTEGTPPLTFSGEEKVQIDFNLSGAGFADVVPLFAQALQFNYVIEGVVGNPVTMSVHQEMTRKQVWEMFRQLLALSGAIATYEENVVHIRPANTNSNNLSLDNLTEEIELASFPLRYMPVKTIREQINQLLPRGIKAIELESSNTLMVLDSRETLNKIQLLIEQLDQPTRNDWFKMVIPCRNVSAQRLATELSEVLPVLGFPVSINTATPQAGAVHLVSLDRLQVIVASAANQDALNELGRWLSVMDQADVGDQERVFIYNIMNGQAAELIKALAVIFPISGSAITTDKDGNLKVETDITNQANAPGKLEGGAASVFDVPVKVFSDAVQNRLVIRTKPRTYAMVKALLERLDTIPNQVWLQVLVIEVTLNDSVQFGVEFMAQANIGDMAGSAGTDYKYLQPGDKEQYGAKYWLYDPDDPSKKYGYINALAGRTNVKVISAPQVMVISHKQSEMNVGDKVPIITAEITDTNSSNPSGTTLVRNVKYEQTGIVLTVTPHVTRGGRIDMDLKQEVSEAAVNKTSSIDSPQIQSRVLKTSMSLRDGQTIICGGIIREKATDNLDSVPVISSVPFLRRLLGSTDVSTTRTEMLVLVTATIVSESTKLEDLTKGYQQSVDSLIEFANNSEKRKTRQFKHSGNLDSWFFE